MKQDMLKIQAELAEQYKYKPLDIELREQYRELYRKNLPKGFSIDGDSVAIYSTNGDLICSGYNRIVIGDYGAFIEFSPEQANSDIFVCEKGQEYRYEDRYKYCKYYWLTIEDTNIKIYQQRFTVTYADYKPGMYYISPHEDLVLGYSINAPKKKAGRITIDFSVIPKNCGECPLYMNNSFEYDEEFAFGDGIGNECPFGGNTFGCLVERPENCPIK